MSSDPTFVLDVPGIGDVIVCPDVESHARRKAGELVFAYRELDALDAAVAEDLGGKDIARMVAQVKKTFPSATIDRILTPDEAVLDAASRWGIAAMNPARQVGRPPVTVPGCPACGGTDGLHQQSCTLEG